LRWGYVPTHGLNEGAKEAHIPGRRITAWVAENSQ